MLSRKAVIIANPGEIGTENYCEGVNKDVTNYTNYLKSPYGGYWYDNEIVPLIKPEKTRVQQEIHRLNFYDYSLVVFSGHGFYYSQSQSTWIELKRNVYMDSNDLIKGSLKQTIILDCCRIIEKSLYAEEMIILAEMAKSFMLNAEKCRKLYDDQITKCPNGSIVLQACDKDETAGDDSARGGYYSFNLINEAKEIIKKNNGTEGSISVVAAHDNACPIVKKISGYRQNPQIKKYKGNYYYPFAVSAY